MELKSAEKCRELLTLMYGGMGFSDFHFSIVTAVICRITPSMSNSRKVFFCMADLCEMCQIVGNWTYVITIIRLHKLCTRLIFIPFAIINFEAHWESFVWRAYIIKIIKGNIVELLPAKFSIWFMHSISEIRQTLHDCEMCLLGWC